MNNTEQFDEWIRGEMNNLDDSPEHFQQADIWQKLQTELHPVTEKNYFFVMLQASHYRIAAAAVALLFFVGGIWWKIQPVPSQIAVNQSVVKPQNRPVLKKKQILLAAKNEVLKEEVRLKKQVFLKKQLKEKPTELNFVKVQNFDKVEIQTEASTEVETVVDASVPVTEQSANPVITKTTPKPKFKIVHANELTDYQRVELAEAKEKEAKAKGFIVINWHTNANNQPENGIMSYLKKKNVTTPTVIVE